MEGNSSAELAKYGERCYGKTCGEGLVCSRNRCKAALSFPCNGPRMKKMECAGSETYDGRSIECKADPDGTSYCCIRGFNRFLPYDRQRSRSPYYKDSGKLGGGARHHMECCSQKAEYKESDDLPFGYWLCT
eukprot:Skav225773  [mRNA]  locus=scaffold1577:20054:20449:+ [translate_table: standard]